MHAFTAEAGLHVHRSDYLKAIPEEILQARK